MMGLVILFLATTAVGWNILFPVLRRDLSFSTPERLALSYIIGLGVITLQMFFYSFMGIRFSILPLLLPHLLLALLNVFVFSKAGPTGAALKARKNKPFDMFLLAGISFQVLHAFFKALIRPMDSYDAIGNFAYKGKLFFIERAVPYSLFLNKNIDIQHVDYPLFIPLSEAWASMFIGSWNELLVKAVFPMFFTALLVIFYFTLRRLMEKRLALVSTFFLATIPHFVNYATIGYADFALAMFYSAGFFYMFLWIAHRRDNRYLFISACLSILAMWTKNEGAALSLVSIAVLLLAVFLGRKDIKRPDARAVSCFILALVVFSVSWFGYLNSLGLSHETVNKETLRLSIAFRNLGRVPLVLYEYQKHIFGPKKWNISLLVFFAGLIVYFRTAFRGNFKYITLSILLALAGYGSVYLITPLDIRYHLSTSGSRLLLHILPLVVFWIGYLAREILNEESNISG